MREGTRFCSREIEGGRERLACEKKGACRDLNEIVLVISGSGKITVEGNSVDVAEGDAFLTRHMAYREISTQNEIEYMSVAFSPESVFPGDEQMQKKLEVEGCGRLYRSENGKRLLMSSLSGLDVASELEGASKYEYALSAVRQTVIILSSLSGESIFPSEDGLGARICSYISDNLTEELSLERIARAFFISKFYLCRAFKDYIGSSIHSYIVAKRVGLAKRLIDCGESASAVAYKVGFGDYSAFYRAYVKHVGKSPTQA